MILTEKFSLWAYFWFPPTVRGVNRQYSCFYTRDALSVWEEHSQAMFSSPAGLFVSLFVSYKDGHKMDFQPYASANVCAEIQLANDN